MKSEGSLRHFPIALFASVMGFAGLTIASKRAEQLFELNHIFSTVVLIINAHVFNKRFRYHISFDSL